MYPFTSSWFLLPQGTGIIAVILHTLPYQFRGLHIISIVFWIINLALLLLFSIFYLVRFLKSPARLLATIVSNTTEVACLASICVASTSAIQMLAIVVVPVWKGPWSMIALVLWWINFAMAVIACLGIPIIFVHSTHAEGGFVRSLTPTAQLPLIAALTSAAGAGTLCKFADLSQSQQIPMIIVSYLEIGIGVPLALALDILFMIRVFQPWDQDTGAEPLERAQVYTDMVLCGPWGQSSFALQSLGAALLTLAPNMADNSMLLSPRAAETLGYASMFGGLLAWGQGTFWWVFAVASITRSNLNRWKKKSPMPFGLPTWAIVFPWVSVLLILASNQPY